MPEQIHELGHNLIAIPLDHGRGYRIELKGNAWSTPVELRSDWASLAQAQEAVAKWSKGKLYSRKSGEGFSLTRR